MNVTSEVQSVVRSRVQFFLNYNPLLSTSAPQKSGRQICDSWLSLVHSKKLFASSITYVDARTADVSLIILRCARPHYRTSAFGRIPDGRFARFIGRSGRNLMFWRYLTEFVHPLR